MHQRTFLTALFLGLFCFGFGQISLEHSRSFAAKSVHFRVDPLGYIVWYNHDVVYKLDTTGIHIFQQSLKAYGDIRDIDVISPMKYLVFFQDQQALGFFDNTFTPYQQRTRLNDLDISYATLVCYSMQFDRFWIYDQDNSKLIQFNSEGKKSVDTENLNGLIGLNDPCQMLERFGLLYLVDEGRGVYIFDIFGALVNFVPIPGVRWIQADENNIYYLENQQLSGYNFKTKSKFHIPLSQNYKPVFQMNKGKFYLYDAEQIHLFEMR